MEKHTSIYGLYTINSGHKWEVLIKQNGLLSTSLLYIHTQVITLDQQVTVCNVNIISLIQS